MSISGSATRKSKFFHAPAPPPPESLRSRSGLQEKGLSRLIFAALPALFRFPCEPKGAWHAFEAQTVGNVKAIFAQAALYSFIPILLLAAFPALPARGEAF